MWPDGLEAGRRESAAPFALSGNEKKELSPLCLSPLALSVLTGCKLFLLSLLCSLSLLSCVAFAARGITIAFIFVPAYFEKLSAPVALSISDALYPLGIDGRRDSLQYALGGNEKRGNKLILWEQKFHHRSAAHDGGLFWNGNG